MRLRGQLILIGATIAFGLAALVHSSVLLQGWEHGKAATAESVIATVLLFATLATLFWPAWSRLITLSALGFALFGTCVGAFTITAGIGPQTRLDLGFHSTLIAGLIAALAVTWCMHGVHLHHNGDGGVS